MLNFKDDDLIKSASYASILVAIIIMLIKSYGWATTDSQSILASLIDSCLDITSSAINLVAIRVALRPPDHNHRFGHDKFQDLAIFSQSIFFFASSLFILFSSCRSLYLGHTPENSAMGINIMYSCILLTLVLVIYQTYVVKRTGSKIIAADKLHYFADFITNIGVVISLYLSSQFWYIDGLVGILVAVYIIRASYTLFREAIHNLSDEEFNDEEREKIIEIVQSIPETKGLHELKTRSAANKPFIQFHLEMDGNLSLIDAHIISDKVAEKLIKLFPTAEIIIHQDPEYIEEKIKCP
jgi:ferrous-iron efflux pump FieF